jgi:hypothetical protein
LIADGMASDGDDVSVVSERGYDMCGLFDGHIQNVYSGLHFDAEGAAPRRNPNHP